jgi:phage tail sheath protein FI
MSAADIDAGRVRCEIIINPASPIERIVVTLSLIEPVPALTQEAA